MTNGPTSGAQDASQRQPCSDGARERADRFVGTAPPARHWFLLEQAGNWGPSAWEGIDLDHDAKGILEDLLETARARLMLIRRPAVQPHGGRAAERQARRRWCVLRSRSGEEPRIVWGTATTAADVLAAARLFGDPDADVPGVDSPQPRRPGPGAPELLLVCTHGRKDVCCAVRGRPVAAAAATLWPEATWECTHTGGDRFAGNLIVLPDGACYGGLDPEDVAPIVRAHVGGHVDPAHLRGPTGFSNQVQAAMVDAFARFAPLAFRAVRPVSAAGSPESWQVRLEVDGIGTVDVAGHTETTEPQFLTCKAGVRKVMHLPVVDSAQVIGEPARPPGG